MRWWDMDLGDRKFIILKHIIDDYINTAQPVGSAKISKKSGMYVSSATVRNEMADLEAKGLILQPHTSAGRIPSDLGYRMYVDFMNSQKATGVSVRNNRIDSLLYSGRHNVEEVIKNALTILTESTGLPAVLCLPLFQKCKLRNLKLIRVTQNKAMMIIVSDTEMVKNIPIVIPEIPQELLDNIANVLLEHFIDTAIENINVKGLLFFRERSPEFASLLEYFIPILRNSLKENNDYEIYVDGVNTIFEIPEFQDINKARHLLKVLRNKDLLYNSFKDANDEMIVRIGKENKFSDLHDLSLVVAPYEFNGSNIGRIGVIGPTRIAYEEIMYNVSYVANSLGRVFYGMYL